jgi:hypothetical protein
MENQGDDADGNDDARQGVGDFPLADEVDVDVRPDELHGSIPSICSIVSFFG